MRSRSTRGLSIVEVVVAALILMVVLAGIWSFSSFGRRSFERDTILAESMDRKMQLVEAVRLEMHTAVRILAPVAGAESRCAAFVDGFGVTKVLFLAPDGRNMALKILGRPDTYLLTRGDGSPVVVADLLFRNEAGKGLGFRMDFRDGTRGTTVSRKIAPLVARYVTHAVD